MKRLGILLTLVVLLAGLGPAVLAHGATAQADRPAATAPADVSARADAAAGTVVILDNFNRADGPIGPNWTVHDGFCNVSNNAAVCGNFGRATFNGAPGNGNVAEADVAVDGTASQYTGLLLNYGAGVSNLFLKVQEQNASGQFEWAACYTGNNGAAFGLGFFALSSPFGTAHMKATRVGNDVTIEFTNIDGGAQPPQTYVCSGAPAPEGTGIGILGWQGSARLDNFGLPITARKEAPPVAAPGNVITYAIVITAELVPNMFMTDVLPLGVAYAGNLNYSAGYAWYDPGNNAVYWTSNPPPSAGTAPAPARPGIPVVSQVTPSRLPETVSGVQPPRQALPAGPHKPLEGGGRLYMTSLDIGNTTFAVYDPATDAWTTLNPYETGCQMAVSGSGHVYAYGYNTGNIDLYDPATDTWTPVMAAPPGSSGQFCNLEVTNGGEFLYTESFANVLWYTSGGVWNTLSLPFSTDAMGDYDPTTDQYVIGEAFTTNAHWIDVHTWTITDYSSPVGNGEYARFGVVMGNRYYFEAGGSDVFSFDLGNPALPPFDHGVSPGWYTSAAGDRPNAVIYSASIDGTVLNLFDPATDLLSPLTGYGVAIWTSSLAYVPRQSVIITFDVTVTAGCGDAVVNQGVAGMPGITVPFSATTQVSGPPPDIDVTPPALAATLCPDATADRELLICNYGECQLAWSIAEMSRTVKVASGGDLSRHAPAWPVVRPEPTAPLPLANVIQDGGFEAGTPNPFWYEYSLNFGTPLCTVAQCGLGGGTGPHTGDWWSWFGGISTYEEGIVSQTVIMLKGTAFLNFWLEVPACDSPADYMEVLVDGTQVFYVDGGSPLCGLASYTLQAVDISAFADGGAHSIQFHSENFAQSGGLSNFFVDDVVLDVQPAVVDIPWLSEAPITGTVGAGECQTVTVTFDSAGLTPGDYFANLLIISNDPDTPFVQVPVTMTVLEPASIITVTYVITGPQVTFDATAAGTAPLSYLWSFGDTFTSTLEDPVHTYAGTGCYDVMLTVENVCGPAVWTDQVCVVGPCDPVHDADFTWDPPAPVAGEDVTFTGLASGTEPFTFTWDFGDGGTGSGITATHAYTAARDYVVTMVVDNPCQQPQTVTHTITVSEAPCVAPAGVEFTWAPTSPFVGDATSFTGTVATGTQPFFYTWNFGDGSGATGSADVGYIYSKAGTFTVTLTVTNTCGMDTAKHTIVVQPAFWYIYLPMIYKHAP